jgi:hypothetical protein
MVELELAARLSLDDAARLVMVLSLLFTVVGLSNSAGEFDGMDDILECARGEYAWKIATTTKYAT